MPKKKSKKKPAGPGVDPNQRRRERLDARREAKAQALAKRRAAERRERIVRVALMAGLFVVAVWFLFLRGGVPDAIAGHQIEDYDSTVPSPPHVGGTIDYEMTPPVTGQHAAASAACGTHASPIPNENFVHTMEHGAVGIVYSPTLEREEISRIEQLVESYDTHVVSAPYEGEMETPIAVTAWANIMRLDSFDEEAVKEFIDVFRKGGEAPEANQDCDNTEQDSFEPSPATSPASSLEASPAPEDGSGGAAGKKDAGRKK